MAEYDLPFSAASRDTSLSTTSMPALAHTYAIPAPIMPAPSTTTFFGSKRSMASGRSRSPLAFCMSKKNAWIMFFDTWPQTRSTK